MLKVFQITLIFFLISTSLCYSQKRRAKRLEKKQKQEQKIEAEETEEEGEEEIEEELEEEVEEDNYDDLDAEEELDEEDEESDEDLDGQEVDPENSKSEINKSNFKEGQSAYKVKTGPSKAALFFEKFQFNFSSGYSLTSWKSSLYQYSHSTADNNTVTSDIKYKGLGLGIPFHIQILFDTRKIRIGGGGSLEFYFMKKLKPNQFEDELSEHRINGIGTIKKFYGHLGYKYFQNKMYAYVADLQVGMFKGSNTINNIPNSYRPFFNIGITIERKYSEYFRMFIKPGIEYKTQPFKINTPENFSVNNHKLLSFYALWGVSYSIPMVKKCPIRSCGVRIHHHHGSRVFRGNPFHRLQNPNYGEEDRKFIRERGKNKKKLDPY